MGGIHQLGRGLNEAVDRCLGFFQALCDKASEVIEELPETTHRRVSRRARMGQKSPPRRAARLLNGHRQSVGDSSLAPPASISWACSNGRVVHIGSVGGPFSQVVLRLLPDEPKAHERLLPNPNCESLAEWLAKSKALYLEAAGILGVPKVRPRAARPALRRPQAPL